MILNCIIVFQRNIVENQFDYCLVQQNEQQWYQQVGYFKLVWQVGKVNSYFWQIGGGQSGGKVEKGQLQCLVCFFVGLNKVFVYFLFFEDEESGDCIVWYR